MSSIKLSSLGLHQTEDHRSHHVVSLCLPLPCFPLLITSKQWFNQTSSLLIGSTACRETELNLPSHLCKWRRAGKLHSEQRWGGDTFDSSRTAVVPSSSWWSLHQTALRQDRVYPDEDLNHSGHLCPEEDLLSSYHIKMYKCGCHGNAHLSPVCQAGKGRAGLSQTSPVDAHTANQNACTDDWRVCWLTKEDAVMCYCVLFCCCVCYYPSVVPHTGSDLVLDEALQSIHFGPFLWVCNHTVQRCLRIQPDWTNFPHLMDDEQEPITCQQHRLMRQSVTLSTHIDRKSVRAVCWGFGCQEDFGGWTFGEPKPGNRVMSSGIIWSQNITPLLLFDKAYSQDGFRLAASYAAKGRDFP